ncbi:RNA polymerase sigma factor [Scatolibacter rhodanostii]|uniref:RNA polymerase sigma factor n=1 Tax=Scatolibacter rhodanostii TaxID=2014781 RepID=UPI000C08582D|nr:sigma-70 family RNA polymerase sigma factor [Scatolibacter rhodanostii]
MKTRLLSFDELTNHLSNEGKASDNQVQIQRMTSAMQWAIKNELTDRQKTCISLYFFEQKSIPQIAKALSLNKSTISRHLTKGKKAIQKVVSYRCAERLANTYQKF